MSLPILPTSREFITHLFDSLSTLPQPFADATADVFNSLSTAPEATRKQLLTLHVLFPNELLPAFDLLDRRLVIRFRIRDCSRNDAQASVWQAGNRADQEASATDVHGQKHVSGKEAGARTMDPNMAEEPQVENSATSRTTPHSSGATESADAEMLDVAPHITEPREPPDRSHDSEGEVHTAQEEGRSMPQRDGPEKAKDTVYYVRSAQQRSSRFSTSYDSSTSYEVRLHAWNCSCPAFAFAAFPTASSDLPISAPNHQDDFLGSETGKVQQLGEWSFGAMSLGTAMPPVCKHLLACVLAERCAMFAHFIEEREVSVDEAAGWAAGWGD